MCNPISYSCAKKLSPMTHFVYLPLSKYNKNHCGLFKNPFKYTLKMSFLFYLILEFG